MQSAVDRGQQWQLGHFVAMLPQMKQAMIHCVMYFLALLWDLTKWASFRSLLASLSFLGTLLVGTSHCSGIPLDLLFRRCPASFRYNNLTRVKVAHICRIFYLLQLWKLTVHLLPLYNFSCKEIMIFTSPVSFKCYSCSVSFRIPTHCVSKWVFTRL